MAVQIKLGKGNGGKKLPSTPTPTPDTVVVAKQPTIQNPVAPTVIGDDSNNTLTASHSLGSSEIVVSTNNSAYAQYTGTIQVGNVTRAAGYWKFKTKAANGRNESPIANSPAFTDTINTPVAPTVVANDTENTLTVTHPLGDSEILVSIAGGPYQPIV